MYPLFRDGMRITWILTFAFGLFWILLGLILGHFWIQVATECLIMMLFAMSFSLLYGYTGLLSFGQGAYFGVGAYGFALALIRLDLAFPLCLLIGIAAAGLWAWVTGYICVRLAGIYFAIMTVVVAQSTFYIIFQWYGFTGGDDGIQGLLPPNFLRHPRIYYYFCLAVVSGAFFAYYKLVNSPFGLSLKCIRENMIRTMFVGIDVRRQRLRAFIIAGLFAGLAGVLFTPFTRTAVPQMADWLTSGSAVFMGVLGGASYVLGPLVGAVVWVFLDAFVTGFTVHWPLILGIITFTVVFFMPGGLMGLISSFSSRIRGLKESEASAKNAQREKMSE
jgi:branched-chain amino acid transport system permease protein